MLQNYQKRFLEFLLSNSALQFGYFVTKSGRNSPYFINTGKLYCGSAIKQLGDFYAQHIIEKISDKPKIIFGPAYKGIPLAVATAISLFSNGIDCGYAFDRKEAKSHGDSGDFVGTPLHPESKLVLVEDVITAGTTLRKIIPQLKSDLGCIILGVFVAVDRCEKTNDADSSALIFLQKEFNIKIYPILTIYQILEFIQSPEFKTFGYQITQDNISASLKYLEKYGAKSVSS